MIQLDFRSRIKKPTPTSPKNLPLIATPQLWCAHSQTRSLPDCWNQCCHWGHFRQHQIVAFFNIRKHHIYAGF